MTEAARKREQSQPDVSLTLRQLHEAMPTGHGAPGIADCIAADHIPPIPGRSTCNRPSSG